MNICDSLIILAVNIADEFNDQVVGLWSQASFSPLIYICNFIIFFN